MLVELHIENFALIDKLHVELGGGFSVLTGETGAGKSIVVDALNAALGERAGVEVIRTGAERALIEAVFDVSGSENAVDEARKAGFEPEDGLLVISREIARSGKSRCRINGRVTTASQVREITHHLVDVHGQHEHQSLLSVPVHIEFFDKWIGGEVLELRRQAESLYNSLIDLMYERERLQTDERERARMLDLYNFQASEIDAANLAEVDEEALLAERNRLANAEQLRAAASEIHELLSGETGSVDALGRAAAIADRIAGTDPSLGSLVDRLNEAFYTAQEAASAVREYADDIELNPDHLEEVEDRLDLLKTLKRKYGDTIEDVLAYREELTARISDLANADARSQELDSRIKEVRNRLQAIAADLTRVRKNAAAEFEQVVERELADLAMTKTRFEVSIKPSEPGPKGADELEFLISPNPGEPVKPLARIASGGEMSRIMLALKTVMSGAQIPVLVFDEIDSGIGGQTAKVLGEKLAKLAEECQVICVTHLPQVASRAANHYCVEKAVQDGRTVVKLRSLEPDARVSELARMLGAGEDSDTAAEHAREMLSGAGKRNS